MVLALVAAGCVFRFSGLELTVFRNDEAQTGTFIAGASQLEIRSELFDGSERAPSEVLELQFPRPGTSWMDTVRSALEYDPKQVSTYFIAARAWLILLPPSIPVLRSFGALLGILCLPLVYLLGRDLFESRLVGWVAVGVMAVSPFRIVYDRDARPYPLWAICILLATWLLVRAVQQQRTEDRASITILTAYSAALTFSLYTHFLTVPMAAAHLAWIIVIERFRWTPLVRGVFASQLLAGILYSQHGIRCIAQLFSNDVGQQWITWRPEPLVWLKGAVISMARIFTDIAGTDFFTEWMYFGLVPLLLALYAVAAVVWKANPEARLFVLLVPAFCTLPMLATDVFSGGIRMWRMKYQLPSVIILQLCVAFAIALLLSGSDRRQRIAAVVSAAVFAIAGIVSGTMISRSEVWWSSLAGSPLPALSKYVNALDNPTLIVGYQGLYGVNNVLALSHRLDEDVRLVLFEEPPWPEPPRNSREVFLFKPFEEHKAWYRDQGWNLEQVPGQRLYLLQSVE